MEYKKSTPLLPPYNYFGRGPIAISPLNKLCGEFGSQRAHKNIAPAAWGRSHSLARNSAIDFHYFHPKYLPPFTATPTKPQMEKKICKHVYKI